MTDNIVPFLPYLKLNSARKACVNETTQGQSHIKPLHRYFAMRLVLEGGFLPQEVTPHPPFGVQKRGSRYLLTLDEGLGSNSEQTVIGGVKTKQIDVVVTKEKVGPVVALSFKATQNAFRNLTNRMEEAVGDCTNLHLRYPSLVYGFYHVILANRYSQIGNHRLVRTVGDVSVGDNGDIEPQVRRYLLAIEALSERKTQWEDPSSYESVCVDFVESADGIAGESLETAIANASPLHRSKFLAELFRMYDLRYPYMAESISGIKRVEWDPDSPLFASITNGSNFEEVLGYVPRLSPN